MSDILFRDDIKVTQVDALGSDRSLVAAARVSTEAAGSIRSLDEDQVGHAGLINFLMKNRHGSPFEHGSMTFLVEAPIFVFREWHRHRIGWSYNEESARYREMQPVFYVPAEERNLVQVGKAGAYSFVPGTVAQYEQAVDVMVNAYNVAYDTYQQMLMDGVAREVARVVLPVGTYSSMYATANPRSIMNFLSLRTKREGSTFPSFPQREIEMAAEQVEALFAKQYPLTHAAFNANGRVAP